MHKSRAAFGLVAGLAASLLPSVVSPQSPAPDRYLPGPPGAQVQNQRVFLTGDGNFAIWRAVLSKAPVGSNGTTKFYQWHLSIYAMRRGAFRLRYESPKNGGPLSAVTQASGAKMWFPVQDASIVGEGSFLQPGIQQLVVRTHEMAADCGSATVSVFGSGPGGGVVPAVTVANPCDLSATIERTDAGDYIRLSGPYYAANAPRCCPTKAHATAVLSFNGKWVLSPPNLFKLYVGKFPPA